VVPIAFVSDHVETLGEIDHEAREEALALGIPQFEMTPGLNDSPTFIAALADLVAGAVRVELNNVDLNNTDVNREPPVSCSAAAD
jgi:ferrochelatase